LLTTSRQQNAENRRRITKSEPLAIVLQPPGTRLATVFGGLMRHGLRNLILAGASLAALPTTAHAFCGFYVAGSDAKMFNDATQVVMMRQGTRTVLSMQNHYEGPLDAFAMVIPVPTVLKQGDVKTLDPAVFAKVETMGAPRLVEYWEQDPCYIPPPMDKMAMPSGGAVPAMSPVKDSADHGVKIEAKFSVGEYNILILSAKDSTGLETWLRQEKYSIPSGASDLLKPYVASGMKFFVAKVDPQKVKFDGNKAMLSPLRFFYDAEEFALPIRLGLANSQGTQDLIVNILSPNKRYEVANYKNVTIPTNINVKATVRDHFGEFYAALYDATIAKNPGAVVTEYAWQAMGCDPCPGPMLDGNDLATLGGDVISGAAVDDNFSAPMGNMVLTRLHARYGKDIKDDLVFKEAGAIVGGREFLRDGAKLEEGARADSNNNFQGRYAIRHPWQGPITCKSPTRGNWGGPWETIRTQIADAGTAKAATNLAFAPRGAMALPTVVQQDIPELALKASETAVVAATPPATTPSAAPPASTAPAAKKKGCGCQSNGDGVTAIFAALMIGAVVRRRRSISTVA
jgi:uncharacterized protein (TIGR03382 family)